MSDWIAPLRSALAAEGRAVLVTLASARGSTPREAGAKMIVTSRATCGSIGGGHLEFEAIRIAREDFAYFGLIGSASKRAQFERRLAARGLSQASIARMACPIGVAGIRNKSPGAIAVAVAAELLQLREREAAQRQEAAEARDTA